MLPVLLSLVLYFWIYPLSAQVFVYPEGTGPTQITCSFVDCSNYEIYYAGTSLVVTCNGNGMCDGLKVYCGTFHPPPGSNYSITDMDNGTVNCLITNSNGQHSDIYFYCKGDNVYDCTFTHTVPGITSSSLECNVQSSPTSVCKYSCLVNDGYCDATNSLLCHSGSSCSCSGQGCGQILPGINCPSTNCDASNSLICQSGSECSCYGQCGNITEAPTTTNPTTSLPTTSIPTTTMPTTAIPTTKIPTTSIPTTSIPTTYAPTTNIPTTAIPTINIPTIATSTQSQSTSNAPTTSYPTSRPTTLSKNVTSTITTTEFIMNTTNSFYDEINNNDMMDVYIIIGVASIVLCIIIAVIIYWYRRKIQYSDKTIIKINSELELNNSPTTITKNNKNNTNIKVEQGDNIHIHKASDSEDMYSDNDVIQQNKITVGNKNDDESDSEKLYDDDNRVLTPNDESKNKGFYCRIIMDYIATDEDQLNLKENEILFIMETIESGWWFGIDENGNDGWIPSNYVKKEQKRQTNIGNLIDNKLDNYLLNMDKYLNITLPLKIVPMVVTNFGSSNVDKNDDEYSSDTDIDNQTLGQQTTI